MGWTYVGHGEWTQDEQNARGDNHGNSLETEDQWVRSWRDKNEEDFRMHQEVWKKGYPNRWGARVPVNTKWNLELMQQLLTDNEDSEVVEWLRYGWPTGRLPTLSAPKWNIKNHKGATDYPQHLKIYIDKEATYGAVMGPYKKVPFQDRVGISPLSTRPKKNSDDR